MNLDAFILSVCLCIDLSSVACSCLLSLVVALGDTGKMLTAISSLITAPTHLTQSTLQVATHKEKGGAGGS